MAGGIVLLVRNMAVARAQSRFQQSSRPPLFAHIDDALNSLIEGLSRANRQALHESDDNPINHQMSAAESKIRQAKREMIEAKLRLVSSFPLPRNT
jgi:DNA-directed RNA polymerase sigma subunit (sigma70/sigma32)